MCIVKRKIFYRKERKEISAADCRFPIRFIGTPQGVGWTQINGKAGSVPLTWLPTVIECLRWNYVVPLGGSFLVWERCGGFPGKKVELS
jgi:hypothetical protein